MDASSSSCLLSILREGSVPQLIFGERSAAAAAEAREADAAAATATAAGIGSLFVYPFLHGSRFIAHYELCPFGLVSAIN